MNDTKTLSKPLRLWPGIAAAALLLISRFGVKAVIPGFSGFEKGMKGAIVASAVILLWWIFASRAPWLERLGAIFLMAATLFAVLRLGHESMGPLWLLGYAVPGLLVAFVAWAVATRRLPNRLRRVSLAVVILLAGGFWLLLRMHGISGDHVARFGWRWVPSPEERLAMEVDAAAASTAAGVATPAGEAPAWPGFRGPGRDGVVAGTAIATDWSQVPPVEVWRRPVGAGWSSVAVAGGLLYTQEQRGDDEVVACYRLTTGEPVWTHADATRFFEANAGPGPRATPTVHDGRVYTFGATGIVNALDAVDGGRIWSRDVKVDAGAAIPNWGFSSSPLVVDDLVLVAAAGQLVAYDLATGEPRWVGEADGVSYSSPRRLELGGAPQVVQLGQSGAKGLDPATGEPLWNHSWAGFPIVQPAFAGGTDLLFTVSSESGLKRIEVTPTPDGWATRERWTSTGLKPYFSDFVVHGEHAYGFDGRILSAIDLETGERLWKGGRYGSGQMILLADQDLLLVLSEQGELALVAATSDGYRELGRAPAIEGKTWNHPALVGDLVLVRNGREMAAFRLAPATG